MINSRDIKHLHPVVGDMCRKFIALCKTKGIDIIITSTYRDAEAQNALYAQGRTTPGKIVTKAKAGMSWHNYKLAFDFAPQVNGKIPWNDAKLFEKCGHLAETCGLEWAGRWVKFKEAAHCQFTGGLTLSDLKAGRTIDDVKAERKPR
jgi:peptidoglycan L-alanyl-D-glutamate endopeptidase CwlK